MFFVLCGPYFLRFSSISFMTYINIVFRIKNSLFLISNDIIYLAVLLKPMCTCMNVCMCAYLYVCPASLT